MARHARGLEESYEQMSDDIEKAAREWVAANSIRMQLGDPTESLAALIREQVSKVVTLSGIHCSERDCRYNSIVGSVPCVFCRSKAKSERIAALEAELEQLGASNLRLEREAKLKDAALEKADELADSCKTVRLSSSGGPGGGTYARDFDQVARGNYLEARAKTRTP